MSVCFTWFVLIFAAVFLMVSLLRWFEQTTDAVDQRDWSKLVVLVVAPLTTWLYPSRVSAGRPVSVPHHDPVRGFGGLPKGGIGEPKTQEIPMAQRAPARAEDGPPPGTPAEFIGMPNIPPRKPKRQVDPEQLEKLRRKMKEQGMLPDDPAQ